MRGRVGGRGRALGWCGWPRRVSGCGC